ncbi:dihydrofolate reductase [Candidatus Pacearchaeota archaeon]|nr:dihydrofolate reductase [Candidatus Pacearchaeota archaeon]
MTNTILFIACSIDGFIAGKNNDLSWLFHDQDYGFTSFFNSIGSTIMGRKTYELSAELKEWPYNGKKCYVITSQEIKDERIIIRKDLVTLVKELKEIEEKDIWIVGGTRIIADLLNAGLLDSMILFMHPVIIDEGIPLFYGIKKISLKPIKQQLYNSGLLEAEYDVIN